MEEFLTFICIAVLIVCLIMLKRVGNLQVRVRDIEILYKKKTSEIIGLLKSPEGSQQDRPEGIVTDKEAETQNIVQDSPTLWKYEDVDKAEIAEGDLIEEDVDPVEYYPENDDRAKVTPRVYSEQKAAARQKQTAEALAAKRLKLEQWIGTRGVLVAGIITSLIGAIFFLKYMSDHGYIGPTGRVIIAGLVGFTALAVGEVTRRRDYGIVARGLTALGFAILYVTVFSAYAYYGILDVYPAFGMSICITIGAMYYAVGLDDVLAAFVALLGGYLSPVLLSTGENRPVMLFSYVSMLSAGAMLCAYFRRWRPVNALAFVGSFLLYTMWFEKYYRPSIDSSSMPNQLPVAVIGLGLFFAIFLILPVLHELVRRVRSYREDVVLILINAMVVLYYFCTILYGNYRKSLAVVSIVLAVAHLAMMAIVHRRCKEDTPLKVALLGLGLFFITLSIPLYFKMYVIAIAWAGEAALLTLIGLRYKSIWTRGCGIVSIALSCLWLILRLPLHDKAFDLILNQPFISWLFVGGAIYICHWLYRCTSLIDQKEAQQLCHTFFGLTFAVLLAAFVMEWYWHVDYSSISSFEFPKGLLVILTVFMLLLVIRPVSPGEIYWSVTATGIAIVGLLIMLAFYTAFHHSHYLIFINGSFAISMIMVLGVFALAWLLRKSKETLATNGTMAYWLAIGTTAALWLLITMEISCFWQCLWEDASKVARAAFLSQMCISVMWAIYATILMIVGFWRKVSLLRYMALGLFGITLIKVFLFDLERLQNIYRIAGFVVLGMALVGISFLYQYGKKKGYFSKVP